MLAELPFKGSIESRVCISQNSEIREKLPIRKLKMDQIRRLKLHEW